VFHADTGKFLWKAPDFINAPVADSTTVDTPTETSLIARDVESGKELWHSSEPMVPGAVINGILYGRSGLNSSSDTFSALQTSDGSQLWTVPFSDSYVKRLEVEQGQIYLLTDNSFSVLQADTGKRLWSVTGIGFGSAFTRGNGDDLPQSGY
jgi:outer membrane protein assembly factor BamB